MSRLARYLAVVALLASGARALVAQSAAEYRARVDSLARVLAPIAAAEAAVTTDSTRELRIPGEYIRVKSIVLRADTQYATLARTAAEHLAPRVERAYGAFADRLSRHTFVVRARTGASSAPAVATGVVDSTGVTRLRSAVYADAKSLENSWDQKVQEIIGDALDPSVRNWLQTSIPMEPLDAAAWSRARIDLLLSSSDGAHRCANAEPAACIQVLGLTPVEDPAFAFYSADQRRGIVQGNAVALRRANQPQFDRCVVQKRQAACDSLARAIPPDAIPNPIPPVVRQSLLRFALEVGGDGAFDRLARDGSIAERIAAAARIPADSVVAQWRAKLLDARTTSTALDVTTALSSLFWIGVCACLAMRSSRWR